MNERQTDRAASLVFKDLKAIIDYFSDPKVQEEFQQWLEERGSLGQAV